MKLFKCAKCGKIVEVLESSPCPTMCCGEPMQELIPGTSDGAHEKHVPVYAREGNTLTVCVGSVEHPMLEKHWINMIIVETDQGVYRKMLHAGDAPKASFALSEGETVQAVYEYCNLHGLWKA